MKLSDLIAKLYEVQEAVGDNADVFIEGEYNDIPIHELEWSITSTTSRSSLNPEEDTRVTAKVVLG